MSDEADIRVRDPVCGRQLRLAEAAAMLDHRGWAHFFCSRACRDVFQAEPDRFAAGPTGRGAAKHGHGTSQQS